MLVHLHHAPDADHDEGRTRARIFGEEATDLYPGRPWGEVEPYMAGDWRAVGELAKGKHQHERRQ